MLNYIYSNELTLPIKEWTTEVKTAYNMGLTILKSVIKRKQKNNAIQVLKQFYIDEVVSV